MTRQPLWKPGQLLAGGKQARTRSAHRARQIREIDISEVEITRKRTAMSVSLFIGVFPQILIA
jgi:hypothetical protein